MIREWVELVGLVLLGSILKGVLTVVYQRLATRIDEKVPDDLPVGAGAWLAEEVFRREIGIRVLAGESHSWNVDAFIPSADTIILSSKVHEKRDASFWAIAAHELGHALAYRSFRLVGWVFTAARLLQTSFAEIATVLILANVLYARADIDRLAFSLLGASLIANGIVLFDEALASTIGIKILSRDSRVSRPALLAGITALLAAFMTYVGAFVGRLLLVWQRDFVITLIEHHRHFEPGSPMGTGTFVVTSLLCVLLVALSIRAIVAAMKSRSLGTPEEVEAHRKAFNARELGRGVIAIVIVALVWSRPNPLLVFACVAGILASRPLINLVLGIGATIAWVVGSILTLFLVTFVLIGAFRLAPSLMRSSPKQAEPVPVNLSAPAPFALSAGDVKIALYNDPPWYVRAAEVSFPLLHMAFAIGVFVLLVR